ncbi:MAG: universal stress protein [Streptosporangiaceae bacterium]
MKNAVARVLVGVDAALRWAEHYAEMADATVEIVAAWQFPTLYGEVLPPEEWRPDDDAKVTAEKAAARLTLPRERVGTRVEQGPAGDVLVRGSRGADLLVVGSRGRGAVVGTLLGSVSAHCARRAHCPVVVVR